MPTFIFEMMMLWRNHKKMKNKTIQYQKLTSLQQLLQNQVHLDLEVLLLSFEISKLMKFQMMRLVWCHTKIMDHQKEREFNSKIEKTSINSGITKIGKNTIQKERSYFAL